MFGRLSVVLLSVRIFALKFFALPIVRLIKNRKGYKPIHASIAAIQNQLSLVSAPMFRWCPNPSNGVCYSRLPVLLCRFKSIVIFTLLVKQITLFLLPQGMALSVFQLFLAIPCFVLELVNVNYWLICCSRNLGVEVVSRRNDLP